MVTGLFLLVPAFMMMPLNPTGIGASAGDFFPPGIIEMGKSIHPVWGGSILIGAWFTLQVVRAFLQYKKESKTAAAVPSELSPTAMIDFLNKQLAQANANLDEASRRHSAEMERLDARLINKATLISRLESSILKLTQDRERGWDLVRELEPELDLMRHRYNNVIDAAYAAGKFGHPKPEGLERFPPAVTRKGVPAKAPEES